MRLLLLLLLFFVLFGSSEDIPCTPLTENTWVSGIAIGNTSSPAQIVTRYCTGNYFKTTGNTICLFLQTNENAYAPNYLFASLTFPNTTVSFMDETFSAYHNQINCICPNTSDPLFSGNGSSVVILSSNSLSYNFKYTFFNSFIGESQWNTIQIGYKDGLEQNLISYNLGTFTVAASSVYIYISGSPEDATVNPEDFLFSDQDLTRGASCATNFQGQTNNEFTSLQYIINGIENADVIAFTFFRLHRYSVNQTIYLSFAYCSFENPTCTIPSVPNYYQLSTSTTSQANKCENMGFDLAKEFITSFFDKYPLFWVAVITFIILLLFDELLDYLAFSRPQTTNDVNKTHEKKIEKVK